jgi:hypothetical protein
VAAWLARRASPGCDPDDRTGGRELVDANAAERRHRARHAELGRGTDAETSAVCRMGRTGTGGLAEGLGVTIDSRGFEAVSLGDLPVSRDWAIMTRA